MNIYFVGRFVDSKDPIFFLKNTIKLLEKKNIRIYMIGKGILKKQLNYLNKKFYIRFNCYNTHNPNS